MPLLTPSAMSGAPPSRDLHVAVVGAGAFGGWTALHLRRMGAKVTLLDGWGPGNSRSSSGGESRLIRGLYGADRIYVEWVARALDLWKQSQERSKTLLYQRTGLLWMFVKDDSYARESLPLAREFGLRIDRLEQSEAKRRFPQVDFDGVKTIYFEQEAGYLKARHACETVCGEFVREGGTFLQTAAKPGATRSESMDELRLADGGTLRADQYVFACGPWLGQLFPEVIGKALRPTRQEVYYFGTPPGDGRFAADRFPGWIDFDERLFYGFPVVDQRGVKIADDTRGADFDPTNGDRSPTPDGVERARTFLGRRFPALKSAPLLEARVCQYENSPDGHLIVDRLPAAGNAWIVGGGSGHGFKLSPALGEHVARCVLGAAAADPMFSISRLAGLESMTTQFDRKQ